MAPVLLLALTLPVVAKTTPKSSTHPPRELHRVGDHYTPYNPPDPSTYPPTAKTYTIKAGDTLWGLAQQFYKNAYLWPQLWEANTWVTDAHWIYPGDTLLVEGESSANANVATTTQPSGNASSSASQSDQQSDNTPLPTVNVAPASAPIPLGTEADLYCYGYIGDPNESMPNRIKSFEDVEMTYHPGVLEQTDSVSHGDLIYIDGGSSTGIVPGETYLVVSPGDLITHPRSGGVIGRQYDYVGQVRILCGDETHSRAIVTQSCRDVNRGDRLKPMPQLPIPIARVPDVPAFCDPPSAHNAGYIVQAKGFQQIIAIGELIQINLGKDDQLQPGDFMTVWRDSPEPGQPRQVLGEIAILTTESHTATARVVQMRRSMEVGDHVEAR